MKAHTRNHNLVAYELTKAVVQAHKHHEPVLNKRYSRVLYKDNNKLFLNAMERKFPCAAFSRVMMPSGVYVWAPENAAGENMLKDMTPDERSAFMLHPPPERKPMTCESRKVTDGVAIKSLPNGKRESDYFPNNGSIRPHAGCVAKALCEDHFQGLPIPKEFIDKIRERITAREF